MLKEFIGMVLIVALFCVMILLCAEKEEELIKTHCSHLTGYEYGQCVASIY